MERHFPHFLNAVGQGIVGFEAAITEPSIAGERLLTIKNRRAYLIRHTACGTCHFLFEKLGVGHHKRCEVEIAVLSRQCLDPRISNLDMLKLEVAAWQEERNRTATIID